MLVNSSGKVRNPAMPKTVSALFVLSPIEREIPDHASPKKAMIDSATRYPSIPVAAEVPKMNASPNIMVDWTITLKASLRIRPNRIADLLTGVASILLRNPERKSSTMAVPDWKELENPFCRTIPATA